MKPLHARPAMLSVAKRLPALLELTRDEAEADSVIEGTEIQVSKIARLVKELFGDRPETYYALIQMDGDRMGAWLAGNEDAHKLCYRETWHPQVRAKVDEYAQHNKALYNYLNCPRASSPARHAAISSALNDFSIHVARHVIEDCVKGKLLYAGGDDVLALVAVDDLFDAMQLLRLAYSGLAPHPNMSLGAHIGELRAGGSEKQRALLLKDGFGLLNKRLMTLMGHKATASMGAVVAHHQAPLGMVLRQLREAEKRAKSHTRKAASGMLVDRDAFCLRILKRGGGEVSLTSPWWKVSEDQRPDLACNALRLFKELRNELSQTSFSRGAIYRAQLWFEGITDEPGDIESERWRAQLAGSLAYQFDRQNRDVEGKRRVAKLARDAVDYICDVVHAEQPRTALENLLVSAEFFAREPRAPDGEVKGKSPDSALQEASA
jgi:CRISPR-associated protein Cmr2